MADVAGSVREAKELRSWLRNWVAREGAERGTRRRIDRFHRWAETVDALLSLAEQHEELARILRPDLSRNEGGHCVCCLRAWEALRAEEDAG